ncbi:MAG: 30S ribosomal protein S3 [Candidatus Daviesbacteria bacterium]|nr:30S ribosomal protein S3 [Candidatus Daviesbacteria bacterium]
MGQKVHPVGFRMGIGATWKSRWYAKGMKYKEFVLEDIKIRDLLMKKLKPAAVSGVEIERAVNKLKVIIYVSRPGILIGRGGSGLTELKKYLLKELKIKNENSLEIAPMELKSADLSSYLVAQSVAEQLARRLPAQRVMNQAIERTIRSGAKGVRIVLSGRIGGAEIARREWKASGTMPLHTLRADIDFTAYPALTKSGYVGVKVWINKGEVEI